MKQSIRKISLIAAAVLALTAAAAAFAEETGEPAAPSTPSAASQPAAETEAVPAPAPADASSSSQETDAQALSQALEAYRTAKQAAHTADLEKELSAYVENGSLTQEQADLILKYYQERMASHSPRDGRSAGRKSGLPRIPRANGQEAADPNAQLPASGSNPGMFPGSQPSPFGRQNRFGSGGKQSRSGSQNGALPADPGQNSILN